MNDLVEYNCPKCGEKMDIRNHFYLLTDPPSLVYECSNCGWIGSPWVSEDSIEVKGE